MDIPTKETLATMYAQALMVAKQSPCTRRQYGSVIFMDTQTRAGTNRYPMVIVCNERVTKCCNDGCLRDALNAQHAESTDIGGEIHSEQAALIRNGKKKDGQFFVLAALKNGKEFMEEQAYPCYSCARMLKYAGFHYVYINRAKDICPVSVDAILEYYEEIWKGRMG